MTHKSSRKEPRSWFGLFFANYGWISVVAAAALFTLTLLSAYQYRLASAFVDHGVKIIAEVVAAEVRVSDGRKSYFLTFRYTPVGGAYGIKHKVSENYFERHQKGSETEIYYLPRQPHQIQTHAFEVRNDAILYQIMAGLSGIAGCGALMLSGARAISAVKARRYGTRDVATVLRLEVINDSDGKPTNQRRLIWRETDGRIGNTMKHNFRYLNKWKPGEEIQVFRGPKLSWWEGDVGPRDAVPRKMPKVPAPLGH